MIFLPLVQVSSSSASGTRVVFEQGKIERSGGAFDVAIDGGGFFVVERGGVRAYTRNGEFADLMLQVNRVGEAA